MKRRLLALTAPLALALSLAACGSVSGIDDLFTQDTGAGGAVATTAGHGGAATSTTSGFGGQDSTSSSPTSASGPSTTTSGPGTTGSTATGSTATATGSTATATAAASSSSGGPMNTVFCNNAECAVDQICCFNLTAQTDHCGQPGTCGDGFITLSCNGPEDCPGGVCCADVDFQKNPPYKSISCQQTCNNPQSNLIVCSDADPTCPQGTQCSPSMILGQGYKICK